MSWRELVHWLSCRMLLLPIATEVEPRPGVTRRQFLSTIGVTAAVLAALPEALVLDEPLVLDAPLGTPIDLSELDALLKEVYAPAILAQVNEESALLRFMERDWKPGDVVPVKIGRNWTTGRKR